MIWLLIDEVSLTIQHIFTINIITIIPYILYYLILVFKVLADHSVQISSKVILVHLFQLIAKKSLELNLLLFFSTDGLHDL